MDIKYKFFLTFGNKYRYLEHPSGKPIHPDGFIEVYAYDYNHARQIALGNFGLNWCWLYTEEEFDPSMFPMGKMGFVDKP